MKTMENVRGFTVLAQIRDVLDNLPYLASQRSTPAHSRSHRCRPFSRLRGPLTLFTVIASQSIKCTVLSDSKVIYGTVKTTRSVIRL